MKTSKFRFLVLFSLVFIFPNIIYAAAYSQEDIKQWKSIGVSEYKILSWKNNNLTFKEAQEWTQVGCSEAIFVSFWMKIGAKTPDDVRVYNKAGIILDNLRDFMDGNVTSLNEAKKWLALDSDTYNIKYWKEANIATPEEVENWLKAGVKEPNEISYWIYIGITTPQEVESWKEIGIIESDTVERWQSVGLNTPEEVKGWMEIDTPEVIKARWLNTGIKTSQEAKKWISIGVKDGNELTEWKDAGVENFDEIKKWIKVGMTNPNNISKWNKIGINNVKTVQSWIAVGITDPDIVNELLHIGIKTPNEYKPYKNISYIDHMKILKDTRITPTPLIEKMSKNYQIFEETLFFQSKEQFLKSLSILKSNDCHTLQDDWFSHAEQYNNKGLCYIFTGKLIQRLGRNDGLAEGVGRRVVHINFDSSWKENERRIGVIKGLGNYTYEILDRRKQIVANGKVLFTIK